MDRDRVRSLSSSTASSSDVVSISSSSSSTDNVPPSPTKRRRPVPLRLNHVGIDPSDVVGRVLRKITRSSNHPVLTLDFTDNTTFQVLVDGYDPVHKGIPKLLEMDPLFDNFLSSDRYLDLMIVDCALITLSDKAFQRNRNSDHPDDLLWDQNHLGIAFKFDEGKNPRWHCVWATLAEYDQDTRSCIFRSYDDVYLEQLQRSPRKQRRSSKPQLSHTLD